MHHLYIVQEIKTKAYLGGSLMEVNEMENIKPKILIVDDSKNIRKLISVILGKEGYELLEADNGLDAVEKINLYKPDMVILDIIIPGINGIEVCKKIKASAETSGTSVIFLTSESTYEAREAARAAGGDVFITKPFEPKDLRSAARELLQSKRG